MDKQFEEFRDKTYDEKPCEIATPSRLAMQTDILLQTETEIIEKYANEIMNDAGNYCQLNYDALKYKLRLLFREAEATPANCFDAVVVKGDVQPVPNGGRDGLFCESVFVIENGKWICEFDNPCEDGDFEPLKHLYLKAKNFIEGSRLELWAPLNNKIEG